MLAVDRKRRGDRNSLRSIGEHLSGVSTSRTRGGGIQGAGLGLAITKRLVDLLRGEITVSSEVGEGTQLRLLSPISLNTLIDSNLCGRRPYASAEVITRVMKLRRVSGLSPRFLVNAEKSWTSRKLAPGGIIQIHDDRSNHPTA